MCIYKERHILKTILALQELCEIGDFRNVEEQGFANSQGNVTVGYMKEIASSQLPFRP